MGVYLEGRIILGRRKTNLKKKKQAKKDKIAIMRKKYETDQMINQALNFVLNAFENAAEKQESYRWN